MRISPIIKSIDPGVLLLWRKLTVLSLRPILVCEADNTNKLTALKRVSFFIVPAKKYEGQRILTK